MIIFVGESASGKSSVMQYLVDNFGFIPLITYTTRAPRDGEIDGVNYHFVTDEKFHELERNSSFAETAVYGGYRYGSAKQDYVGAHNKVSILRPHGVRQLKKNGIEVYVVHIKVPRRIRLIRLLRRGDDIDTAYRRNLSDTGQYDGIEDEADFVIYDCENDMKIQNIAEAINNAYTAENQSR
ncbi:hypothetical protein AALB53_22460 [Lachnospiraceae bacterium 47-T17]